MPRFERSAGADGPIVQGFAGDRFSVDGRAFDAVLLTPRFAAEWTPPAFEELTIESVEPLFALDPSPEFLILGTGSSHRPPPRGFVAALDIRGFGVEAMDSRAAARTWGLLRGEGRWIVAAMMPLR